MKPEYIIIAIVVLIVLYYAYTVGTAGPSVVSNVAAPPLVSNTPAPTTHILPPLTEKTTTTVDAGSGLVPVSTFANNLTTLATVPA